MHKKISQGDFSVSGVIIMDLKGVTENKFKARVLLDSGAGTNFISKEILPHIKYDKLESEGLIVSGINTTQENKHELIKIYLDNKECPVEYLKCYVLENLIEYELDKEKGDHWQIHRSPKKIAKNGDAHK